MKDSQAVGNCHVTQKWHFDMELCKMHVSVFSGNAAVDNGHLLKDKSLVV